MTSLFSSQFFSGNRQRLRTQIDTELIIVTAAGLLQRSADTTFRFRQDSNFWYLTGIDDPDIILVMDKDEEYLLVPEFSDPRVRFEGGLDTALLQKRSGIKSIVGLVEGWQRLSKKIKRAQQVATLTAPPPYIEWHNFYTNPARAHLIQKIQSFNNQLEFIDLKPALTGLRLKKQPEELTALQRAINITTEALVQLQPELGKLKNEYEVEAVITHYFRWRGAQHGFDPMVAFGSNATTAHSMGNSQPIKGEGLLLVDVGAEVEYYSADMSRTFAPHSPTKRQQAVYAAVKDVFDYALGLLKPGVSIRANEKLVELYMGKKLRQLGLIKSIRRQAVRRYFTHATSHFLGLDLHDVGDYDKPLEPGMVLTVEPGIYILEEAIGVRLEDDILITKNGISNLSAKLPLKLV